MREFTQEPVSSAPVPALNGRGLQLLLIAAAMAASNYGRTALGPLQESVRTSLALNDNQMALVQGPAITWPIVLAAVPLGLLIDRYCRARLLFIFVLCAVLGTFATSLARDFASLFLVRCFVGVAAAAIPIAALSLVADLYEPEQRGRAKIVVAMGELGGATAVFAIGGFVLGHVNGEPRAWQSAVTWLAVPMCAVALAMLALSEPGRGVGEIKAPIGRALRELWSHRSIVIALLAAKIMVGLGYGAVLTWAAPALSRTFDLPPGEVGGSVALVLLISGIVGPIAGGLLADFCQRTGGPRRTMVSLSVLALLAAPAALFALAPTALTATVSLTAFMILMGIVGTAEMTLTTIVIPAHLWGLCLSVLIATGLIFGVGLAPLTVSMLAGLIGGPEMIGTALSSVCTTVALFGAVTLAIGRRFLAGHSPSASRSR